MFSINEFTFLLNFKLRHRKESKEETISFFCHSRQVQILGALAIFLEGKGCYCTFKIYMENSQYVRKIIPTQTGYVCFPLQCRSLQLQRATTLRIESSIMNVTRMFALNTYMIWFLEKIFRDLSIYSLYKTVLTMGALFVLESRFEDVNYYLQYTKNHPCSFCAFLCSFVFVHRDLAFSLHIPS